MNSTLNKIMIFAAGATIGAAVAWRLAKTKYEQIANEEIASMRELLEKRLKEDISEESEKVEEPTSDSEVPPVVNKYNDILTSNEYFSYDEAQEMRKHIGGDAPYVIEPAEYGEFEDYDLISLTYYADGVLVDDCGDPIEDISAVIGRDSLDQIGKYEPDSVHVRNDKRKADYEILVDYANYSDLKKPSPHIAEDQDDED